MGARHRITIQPHDILIIHTGYHRYYPENWTNLDDVDETKYFIRHPGPTRPFAEWLIDRKVRYLAVDAGSADHPMNTVIRRIRADEAEDAEAKLGKSLTEVFPKADYQLMHTLPSRTTSFTLRTSAERSTTFSINGSSSAASRGASKAGKRRSAARWRSPT